MSFEEAKKNVFLKRDQFKNEFSLEQGILLKENTNFQKTFKAKNLKTGQDNLVKILYLDHNLKNID